MKRHQTDQRRAVLQKTAQHLIYPLTQSKDPYVSMGTLGRFGIKCKDMDFRTGQVVRREPFIQAIPPQEVQQWLEETMPAPKERRDIVNEYSHEFPNDAQWEATIIWRCIYTYISEYENTKGNCAMTSHTQWLNVSSNNSRFVNRLCEQYTNWQLKCVLRQHLPNASRYDRIPDPTKPHAMCYLADEATLQDDVLLTSELTTLLLPRYFDGRQSNVAKA
ncbi:1-phosphatidylinositol-4,5-bisphosphate phosphodiesterase 1 [Fusarium austroafricanum]|uniref:1-phosphatidylinositol-4,5-bisphosphate phosphodiesterase 1 n=1 Tax=Fusarium austroafricanum TaxID=2364996 RepID=A0A8H4P4Y6_9HYPO|nr:1-phosphatidylinositol-4,5-bisphosphate phosphodiesterase 1 [Fusarium austroafricanum]